MSTRYEIPSKPKQIASNATTKLDLAWRRGMKITKKNHSGYATVTLMMFIVIGIIVTTAATTIIAVNSLSAQRTQDGLVAYNVAESGMENGIIRFLRDPVNYTGETITTDNGSAVIIVASDKKSITSVGTSGSYVRKIQAQIDYSNKLDILSWQEIY